MRSQVLYRAAQGTVLNITWQAVDAVELLLCSWNAVLAMLGSLHNMTMVWVDGLGCWLFFRLRT